MKIYCWN